LAAKNAPSPRGTREPGLRSQASIFGLACCTDRIHPHQDHASTGHVL